METDKVGVYGIDVEAVNLTKELSELSKKQLEALQRAAFINMSAEEMEEADDRRKRMSELCSLLSKVTKF